MLPLLAVSSEECVDALLLAGFVVTSSSHEHTTLHRERDARTVAVTRAVILPPEALEDILRAAGVPYTAFLDLLAETPTQPAMSLPMSGVRGGQRARTG